MSKLKLHIGCGSKYFGKDWVHIDKETYNYVDGHDVESLLYSDESVDLIYASHLIEYFDGEAVVRVLKEWWRVLKYGGTLRLAVPDFEAMARLYVEKMFPLVSFIGPLYGKMMVQFIPTYHRMVYDYDSLSALLGSCGFRNIRRWDWRETEHAQFDDCSQAYLPKMDKINGTLISLNTECEK